MLKPLLVDLVDCPCFLLLQEQEPKNWERGFSGSGMNLAANARGHLFCSHPRIQVWASSHQAQLNTECAFECAQRNVVLKSLEAIQLKYRTDIYITSFKQKKINEGISQYVRDNADENAENPPFHRELGCLCKLVEKFHNYKLHESQQTANSWTFSTKNKMSASAGKTTQQQRNQNMLTLNRGGKWRVVIANPPCRNTKTEPLMVLWSLEEFREELSSHNNETNIYTVRKSFFCKPEMPQWSL